MLKPSIVRLPWLFLIAGTLAAIFAPPAFSVSGAVLAGSGLIAIAIAQLQPPRT